ncbi:hypothetical protein D0860_00895 [Hortaea werneckii]|uniref:Histone H4 n=1 Tax=Hortaea werneckii TaxID=91943 RepID=A0A3M7HUC4_HORWE|nr:hypothetical protein D0860_00895 [Hortaea werneckii]
MARHLVRSDVSGSQALPGGRGKTLGGKDGKGLGIARGKTAKRHRCDTRFLFNRDILRDNIQGITRPDIRRLARRGGVKRVSAHIYDEVRQVLRAHLERVLRDVCAVVETCGRKTVCTSDVVFTLQRMGRTLYGFGDPER